MFFVILSLTRSLKTQHNFRTIFTFSRNTVSRQSNPSRRRDNSLTLKTYTKTRPIVSWPSKHSRHSYIHFLDFQNLPNTTTYSSITFKSLRHLKTYITSPYFQNLQHFLNLHALGDCWLLHHCTYRPQFPNVGFPWKVLCWSRTRALLHAAREHVCKHSVSLKRFAGSLISSLTINARLDRSISHVYTHLHKHASGPFDKSWFRTLESGEQTLRPEATSSPRSIFMTQNNHW